MRIFRVAVFLMAGLGWLSPAYAESVSVRVSCTVLPVLEIGSPAHEASPDPAVDAAVSVPAPERLGFSGRASLVHVRTNMGKAYRRQESSRETPQGPMKVFTVTAL